MSKQVTRPATVRKARTAAPSATVRLYALLPGMRPTSGPRLLSHQFVCPDELGKRYGPVAANRRRLGITHGLPFLGWLNNRPNGDQFVP